MGLACASSAIAADTVVTIPLGVQQTAVVTASPAAGDTYTLNIQGNLLSSPKPPPGFVASLGSPTAIKIQGSGAGTVQINNNGILEGRLSFATATGAVRITNNTGHLSGYAGGWHTQGTSAFGSGDDRIVNTATGVIATTQGDGGGGGDPTVPAIFAFGAGNDTFVNEGRIIIDRTNQFTFQGTLIFTGLETFENSGLILMGAAYGLPVNDGVTPDKRANDLIDAQGVNFVGSGDSRISMDVELSTTAQINCAVIVSADCVNFTGGSTDGSTLLTINNASVSKAGGLNPTGMVLILGSSAAEHFTLDPASDGYVRTTRGEGIQTRLTNYELIYDAANKRHLLVGIPADEAFQGATFAASAQETWRAVAGTWFDRQADLRATPGGLESSSGLWARAGFSAGEREPEGSYTAGANTYAYDLAHSQRIAQVTGGVDLLGASSQDIAWVIGVMGGVSRTDVEYDATPTEVTYTGFTGGLYASLLRGSLFVDASVSGDWLDMNADAPNMNLGDSVSLSHSVTSWGAQAEAGWRVMDTGGLFLEPLASVVYVSTTIDDLMIPGGGGGFDFEESYASLRIGGGLRVGMDTQLMGVTAAYSLTGRYWTESEGQNPVDVIIGEGATATTVGLVDDVSGSVGEIGASLNVYSDGGVVSGFVNAGGKFSEDYRSIGGSVGVRLRW